MRRSENATQITQHLPQEFHIARPFPLSDTCRNFLVSDWVGQPQKGTLCVGVLNLSSAV